MRSASTDNGDSGSSLLELKVSAYRLSTATLLRGRGRVSLVSIFSGSALPFQTLDTAKNENATQATVKHVEGEKKECEASMLGARPKAAQGRMYCNAGAPFCCKIATAVT
jgi:hypothetical protein